MKSEESKMLGDDDYLNNLQEEVRKLHFQLKQKDAIIEKLKLVFAESKGSDEGDEEGSGD